MTLSNYERGGTTPDDPTLEKLAELYGVPAAVLRYGDVGADMGSSPREPDPSEVGGQWEPAPESEEEREPSPRAAELQEFLTDMERVVRTLKTLPSGSVGKPLKLEFLSLVERAAMEAGQRLPPEFWDYRRRVIEGEL